MTRRSLELIASADAILYDRLIPPGALDGARPDAELRYVGKEPGAAALSQEEINALLVELGRAGRRVVRLKGGDPFVFGRGGEEAEALAAAGVPFEVVPGVTAGVAAPAYAGHPGHAPRRRLRGRVRHGPRGPGEARSRARLGRPGALPRDARLLHGDQAAAADRGAADRGRARSERGRRGDRARHATPVSAPWSTRSAESPRAWRPRRSAPPAITVVGAVAKLRETIAWLEGARSTARWSPSRGRARRRAAWPGACASSARRWSRRRRSGSSRARSRGICEPRSTRSASTPSSASRARTACTCSSTRSAAMRADAGDARGDARASPGPPWRPSDRGPPRELRGTASAPTSCPSASWRRRSSRRWRASSSRAGACSSREPPRRATCCPMRCASAAPTSTSSRSTTRSPSRSPTRSAPALARANYVTFTSSSTVRFLLDVGRRGRRRARGSSRSARSPAATAREHGLEVDVEAERHDIDGLVDALVAERRAGGSRRDRHAAHRLRARRRVRRRLPRGDPRASQPDAEIVDITHGIDRYAVQPGRARAAQRASVHAGRACTWRSWIRRWAPSGARSRCAAGDGRMLVGPGQRAAEPRLGAVRRRSRSPWTSPARRTGSSRCRPPSTAATCSRRWPRTSPPARSSPTPATRSTPTSSSARAAASRARRTARSSRTRSSIDRFGNVGLDVDHDQLRGHRPHARAAGGGRGRRRALRGRRSRRRSPTCSAGELLVYEDAYRTLALAINRGDAAGTLGARAPTPRCGSRPDDRHARASTTG